VSDQWFGRAAGRRRSWARNRRPGLRRWDASHRGPSEHLHPRRGRSRCRRNSA